MVDRDGSTTDGPEPAAVPPPGFAGGPPVTPPAGFGALPPAAPPPAVAVPRTPAERPSPPRRGSRWPIVLVVLLLAAAVAGFLIVSGGDDDAPAATTTVATTAPAPTTTALEGIPDQAAQVACETELSVVQTAVQAYRTTYGEAPPDLEALVGEFLDATPTKVAYTPEGGVVPAGDCA